MTTRTTPHMVPQPFQLWQANAGDDAKFTQADLDAAIEKAVGPLRESVDKLETKNSEIISENRRLKKGADIKPEDLQAAEERADKAETRAADLDKQVKALASERDKAVKSLESEQGAARSYALEAEIASAIAEGNVVPALVPAFKAMISQQAKADLVDGKYSVTIGEKAAKEYITAFLSSDEGKAFKAAAVNTGGGAPGGKGGGDAKTMTRAEYDAKVVSDPTGTKTFLSEGGKIVNEAA